MWRRGAWAGCRVRSQAESNLVQAKFFPGHPGNVRKMNYNVEFANPADSGRLAGDVCL